MEITKAPWHLTYNRELDDQRGEVLGPNVFGELFVVFDQEYNSETKKTTLGLVLKNVWEQSQIKAVK